MHSTNSTVTGSKDADSTNANGTTNVRPPTSIKTAGPQKRDRLSQTPGHASAAHSDHGENNVSPIADPLEQKRLNKGLKFAPRFQQLQTPNKFISDTAGNHIRGDMSSFGITNNKMTVMGSTQLYCAKRRAEVHSDDIIR